MNIKIGLFLTTLVVIGISDILPAVRQKKKDMLGVIAILLVTAFGLQGGKWMGWRSPVEWLHVWISPLGRIIWKS